jgi:hypothetical protein
MSNVITFKGRSSLDVPCEIILNKALNEDLETVLIVGRLKSGEIYLGSSTADGGDLLWLMAIVKKEIMS